MDIWAKSYLIATADNCDKALTNYQFHVALNCVKNLWLDLSMIYLVSFIKFIKLLGKFLSMLTFIKFG